MLQPIFGLVVISGFIVGVLLGFATPSEAQNTPPSVGLEQLSADERLQLRSQLKNRRLSVGDINGTASLRTGLTPEERQALRNLLRELDAGQIHESQLPASPMNLEARNDGARIADPLSASGALAGGESDRWPLVDAADTHRQDSVQ